MSATENLDLLALEAAKHRMGEFAWPTVVLGVIATGGYVAIPFLVAASVLPLWLAMPLMILLAYASYTVLHEAVHGSISGSKKSLRWLNELLGYMAGFVLFIPMTAHRHAHLAHHRHANDAESDPDHVVAGMTASPLAALRAGERALRSQYVYYMSKRWASGQEGQNLRFCLEVAASVLLRIAIILLTNAPLTLLLFAVAGIGGTLLTMYLFAYIVHVPHDKIGRYEDTSTILVDGPLGKCVTVLWLFQNYHSIHHLFPRVPFYHYARLFDEIRPVLVSKGAPIYRLGMGGMRSIEAAATPVSA